MIHDKTRTEVNSAPAIPAAAIEPAVWAILRAVSSRIGRSKTTQLAEQYLDGEPDGAGVVSDILTELAASSSGDVNGAVLGWVKAQHAEQAAEIWAQLAADFA